MKRKSIITLLSSLTAFVAAATAFASVAWFIPNAIIQSSDNIIKGVSEGAYYEDGDGLTEETAFIISKPRHLYNLAWLHYLGYYNDTAGNQYYFKIKNDIDMTGWKLPPIGTEENPFISNFNGQNHTISNLTVSNSFSDFSSRRPSRVNETYFNSHKPSIVGFFGVVGDYNNRYTVDGENKDGVTYNSQINKIINTGIYATTVKSDASQTLVGLAAGYVNATLSNVAVNNSNLYTSAASSAITSITNSVSDYSLVGYCTEDYLDDIRLHTEDADIPTLENPNTISGGDQWGGSIDMHDMYSYLREKSNSAAAFRYPTAETITTDVNGNTSTNVTGSSTISYYSEGFGEYYRYEGEKVIENEKEYASFTFARSSNSRNFNSYNDADDSFICLYGGERMTPNATKNVTTNDSYFKISSSGNYLVYYGSLQNTTNHDSGDPGWRWDGNYIYFTYNSSKYYLNVSGGNLSASTTKNTQWTYSGNNLRTSSGGTTYYLTYSTTNSRWEITTSSGGTYNYYLISYNNNYMTHPATVTSAGAVTNTSSTTEPTSENVRWYWQSGNKFSATRRGDIYTLRRNGNSVYYDTSTTTVYSTTAKSGSNLLLSASTGGWFSSTYYVRYNDGWSSNNRQYNATRLTITEKTATGSDHDINLTEYVASNTTREASYYDTYPTYFPLTREKGDDGEYTGSGKPDIKNTGYVISGSNLDDDTQGPYGDIRVSRFNINDISVSLSGDTTFSSNRLEIVTRTCVRGNNNSYTDSNWTRISDDYNANNSINNTLSSTFTNKKKYKEDLALSKYKTSRDQLNSTLSSGEGHIYGLHFMDAAISTSNLITAPNVIVLDGKTLDEDGKAIGSEYSNYQLPQDSIDFYLKDQGFINFFAGTYFTNNNTFFSLHKITRNANNEITDISKIQKIYAPASGDPSDDNPYVYSYDGTKPTNSGDLVFDVSWIMSPSMVNNAVYYFEIPVNSGEYALGSVSGRNGAYLMYLDIGAGIANYKDITITEHAEILVNKSVYPAGVDFVDFTSGSSWGTVNGGDSAAVVLAKGTTTNAAQTLNFVYDDQVLTVSTANTDPPIGASFTNLESSIKKKIGDAAATDLVYTSGVHYNMVRDTITSENFNVFTNIVTRTINETFTITGGSAGTQIQLSLPRTTANFSVVSAASFAVTSGTATVTSAGLVTLSNSSTVVVSMTYTEEQTGVETWSTASTTIADATEGTIFAFHFIDPDNPNIVIRYVYDGINKVYTVYITAVDDTTLIIDTLPLEGYTVEVVINNNTANKTVITSEYEGTSINITGSSS